MYADLCDRDQPPLTPEPFTLPEAPVERSAGEQDVPRWSRTPPAMKARFQLDHAKKSSNKVWSVNNNPERLDEMYVRLLGPRGDKVLPEELKWLSVTHKSFDQGRRGFNDRLALMGKHGTSHRRGSDWGQMETDRKKLRTQDA